MNGEHTCQSQHVGIFHVKKDAQFGAITRQIASFGKKSREIAVFHKTLHIFYFISFKML
jgi:hypothetical protein